MEWLNDLGKDRRGSRPRCVLVTDGDPMMVAQRLTGILARRDVQVASADVWQPRGKTSVKEVQLDKPLADGRTILRRPMREQLREWWLAAGASSRTTTPNWDIASTSSISGKMGLLLVEAKAHGRELSEGDKCGAAGANRASIEQALSEANTDLRILTRGAWELSLEHHYQLSNRFAWSWKIASLGVPVVLLYLGFLNVRGMSGPPFKSEVDWREAVMEYGRGIVDEACWETAIDVQGTPFLPLIRVIEQPCGT